MPTPIVTEDLKASMSRSLPAFIAWTVVAFLGVFGLVVWGLAAPAAVAAGARASVSAWSFIATFGVATAIMLVFLRWFKSPGAVVTLLRVSLVLGVVLLAWRLGGEAYAVAAVPTVVLAAFLYRRVWAVDLVVIAACAGIAIEVGAAMTVWTAVIVLAFLAVYDLVAVFGTKHMVFMAERLMGERAIFALAIPSDAKAWLADFGATTGPRRYALLGMGDLVLPTVLFAAAYRATPSAAVATAGGIIAGVFVLAYWLKRRNFAPLPALPPLAGGAVVGFLVWLGCWWVF